MPIFELGYRGYEGVRRGPLHRVVAIARTGVRLAMTGVLLRRLLFVAWAPVLYFGPLFFAIGYVTDPKNENVMQSAASRVIGAFVGEGFAKALAEDPLAARPVAWSLAFFYFFSTSQALLTMLVVAIVAPPLIAQDVRTKAFLVYFSKPITRWEYALGKAATVCFFIFVVSLFPALALYGISISFAPTIGALFDTSGTLVSIALASLVVAIPPTCIALFLSSLTRESKVAAFAWVAFWIGGEVAFRVLKFRLDDADWIFLASFREIVAVLIARIFQVGEQVRALGPVPDWLAEQLRPGFDPGLAIGFLIAMSVVSAIGLVYRVTQPLRV